MVGEVQNILNFWTVHHPLIPGQQCCRTDNVAVTRTIPRNWTQFVANDVTDWPATAHNLSDESSSHRCYYTCTEKKSPGSLVFVFGSYVLLSGCLKSKIRETHNVSSLHVKATSITTTWLQDRYWQPNVKKIQLINQTVRCTETNYSSSSSSSSTLLIFQCISERTFGLLHHQVFWVMSLRNMFIPTFH